MSAQSTSLLGYGLYFIDVLACLLFCITLALTTARFGREQTVDVELPRMQQSAAAGSDLTGSTISLREEGDLTQIYLDEEALTLEELRTRLAAAPPASLVVRSEESQLARVIAIAHTAGVLDIQLAYDVEGGAP